MKLLGIRLDEHDASYCYYDNGSVKYIKTERYYQEKHHAYSAQYAWASDFKKFFNEDPATIDEIAIVADPVRYVSTDVNPNQEYNECIDWNLPGAKCPVYHIEHHLAHALSGWMEEPTDYQFVFDGVGEVSSNDQTYHGVTWSVFKDYKLVDRNVSKFYPRTQKNITVSNSFGVEYENCARYCGLTADHPNDLAGKLMSLQSYGTIDYDYAESILDKIKDEKIISEHLHPQNWFDYKNSDIVAENTKLDFAATNHYISQQLIMRIIAKNLQHNNYKIFLSGGCALNICWNTTIKKTYKNTLVLPHSADDGLSIGALGYLLRKHNIKCTMKNFPYCQFDEGTEVATDDTIERAATMLAEGKVIGWYQGNGEVGPRALGNRSILVNPVLPHVKDLINSKVKNRESYRPFGASVLKEYYANYFDIPFEDPHMLYLAGVKKYIPAITHVDKTCRIQTVDDTNPVYKKLIEKFHKKTGVPLLLNTSLNLGGKPIAGWKQNALELFETTNLDAMIIGNDIHV